MEYLNLSTNQERLTVISLIGTIIQVSALCFIDNREKNWSLLVFFLIVSMINSVVYYKVFSD
jgi:hypothetical protein